MSLTNELLLAVAVMFALFNFWRFFQVRSRRRRGGAQTIAAVRSKAKDARATSDPGRKAELFVEAGDLARAGGTDQNLAVAYYLRALRSDPASRPALAALSATLGSPGSFRRLERVYWRLLSRVPPGEATLDVWRALADLYGRGYRHRSRARAIRLMLEVIEKRA
ncbi:MAG: hypothetical protein HYY06_11390 [Deltaproteobacteria bacterium]|nr:hypothetical protein [Deltaproteobacteria bacterium]